MFATQTGAQHALVSANEQMDAIKDLVYAIEYPYPSKYSEHGDIRCYAYLRKVLSSATFSTFILPDDLRAGYVFHCHNVYVSITAKPVSIVVVG